MNEGKKGHKFRSCEGKKPFTTKKLARKAARAISYRTESLFNAYKCQFCDSWHIGHHGAKKF